MHWFWRATIAMAVGSVGGWVFYCLPWYIYPMVSDPVIWTGEEPVVHVVWFITFPVTALMTVVPYALLTRYLAPKRTQTRRRR